MEQLDSLYEEIENLKKENKRLQIELLNLKEQWYNELSGDDYYHNDMSDIPDDFG